MNSEQMTAQQIEQLETSAVDDRLRWIWKRFPDQVVIASSFGQNTLSLIHRCYHKLDIRIPVIFIDTLYHFPETLSFVEQVRQIYQLDLRIYRPAPTRKLFEKRYGAQLWEHNVERFHLVTKLRPMQCALQGQRAWISGIRRDQAHTRTWAPLLHWDEIHQLWKMNPVVDWSTSEIERYLRDHDIPQNPLLAQGYSSIGDAPLTEPVSENEHPRAGRWRGLKKTECGLHCPNSVSEIAEQEETA